MTKELNTTDQNKKCKSKEINMNQNGQIQEIKFQRSVEKRNEVNKMCSEDACQRDLNLVLKDTSSGNDNAFYSDQHVCVNSKHNTIGQDMKSFRCGSCAKKFRTICHLHEHLLSHHETGGSYHYDHYIHTAFPKYDTFCRLTQTDFVDQILKDSKVYQREENADDKQASRKGTKFLCEKKLIANENEIHIEGADSKIRILETLETDEEKRKTDPDSKDVHSDSYVSDGTDDYFDYGDESGASSVVSKYLKETESDDTVRSNEKQPVGVSKLQIFSGSSNIQSSPSSIKDKKINKLPVKKKRNSPSKTDEGQKNSRKEKVKVPPEKLDIDPDLTDPIPNEDCKCELCGAAFSFKRGLLRHEQTKHADQLKYSCQYCEYKFMRRYNLQKHIKCVHTLGKNYRYKEKFKGKKTHEKIVINEISVKTDADNERGVQQENSGKAMKKSSKKKEDSTLLKSPHTCDICGYTMPKSKMDVHQRLHTGERPFMCHLCGKGLISQNKLKRHLLIHSEVKKHTCDVCGVGFQMKYKLRMHMHIHTGKKPYLCSICGAEFNHSSNLATHTRCVHLQIKPFVCSECGRCYAKRSQLDDHLLSHSTERQFTCRYCGKSFKYYKGMRRHEKNHTEEKGFQCDRCDCQFSRRDNLERHKASHDEPCFKCKVCKKSFNDEKMLRIHEVMHAATKKFQCIMCGEGYRVGNQYYTHMLAAHNIQRDHAKALLEDQRPGTIKVDPAMDPNLPLQIEPVALCSNEAKVTSCALSMAASFSVDQVVPGLLVDNHAALNALTRVATENLRLHSEDINHLEKIPTIQPSVNPMILLDSRNQGSHMRGDLEMGTNLAGSVGLTQLPGSDGSSLQHNATTRDGICLPQSRESISQVLGVNMSQVSMNNTGRNNYAVNLHPLNVYTGMRQSQDSRSMSPERMQIDGQSGIKHVQGQAENHSVTMVAMGSQAEGIMGSQETGNNLHGEQSRGSDISYRMQNLY